MSPCRFVVFAGIAIAEAASATNAAQEESSMLATSCTSRDMLTWQRLLNLYIFEGDRTYASGAA